VETSILDTPQTVAAPEVRKDVEPRLGVLPRPRWSTVFGRIILSFRKPVWMAADAGIALIGLSIGYAASPWDLSDPAIQIAMSEAWLVSAVALALAGLIVGLYEHPTLLSKRRLLIRPAVAILAAACLSYVVISGAMYAEMSRRIIAWMVATCLIGGTGLRLAAFAVLRCYRRTVLVVGTGPSTRLTARAIQESGPAPYHVAGLVLTGPTGAGWHVIDDLPVVGHVSELSRLCVQYDVREVVLGDEAQLNDEVVESALSCLSLGCRVTNESTFYEKAFGEVPVSRIGPHWFLFADLGVYRDENASVKRAVDVLLSLVGLAITLPFWPLIMLSVKLSSPGPVFHRQQRVGQGGRTFVLYKFRTMREGSERDGSIWATRNDPRATPLGRWLRRTHADELPQLWNVLRGHMSLVGPRPERPDLVDLLAAQIPYYNERHLVKPGLTGWAQINFRYGSSVADARKKLQLDLYYIKYMSLELDVGIMLRTIGMILSGST